MQEHNLDALLRDLLKERRRLDALRSDYAVITRSRFHALRMLWFSFKQALGLSSARDRFAVSSSGMTLTQTVLVPLPAEEARHQSPDRRRLATAWRERIVDSPLSDEPIVTIVIPVYNKIAVTVRCLESIVAVW